MSRARSGGRPRDLGAREPAHADPVKRDPERALARLAASLPPGRVSVAEADLLAVAQDAWPRHLVLLAHGEAAALPAAVVWPETAQEVQLVVVAARELGLSLVPVGGGSSVVGGATPAPGQVVLDLKRMQRVLDIDG
ncbi:MAG: FAD-binding oxidoreductase, partial [Deltaproteobacteria bacterium]|nr:FAD-binding oxidoreductase [Deltaproteobacteria bacterium]